MFHHYQFQIYFCDLLRQAVFNYTTVSEFYYQAITNFTYYFIFIQNIILGISPNSDIHKLNQITFKYKMQLQENNIFMKNIFLHLIQQPCIPNHKNASAISNSNKKYSITINRKLLVLLLLFKLRIGTDFYSETSGIGYNSNFGYQCIQG